MSTANETAPPSRRSLTPACSHCCGSMAWAMFGLVPDTERLAAERVVGQHGAHARDGRLAGALRIGRVRGRPCLTVVEVAAARGAELDVQQVLVRAGERRASFVPEDLGGVSRFGRRADHHDEGVGGRVRGGHHVVEGSFGQDLRLVEHDLVDAVESSSEPLFAGAEQDARSVVESDFLLAVGAADGGYVAGEFRVVRQCLHAGERFVGGAGAVCGPQHLQSGCEQAVKERGGAEREGLAHLAGQACGESSGSACVFAVAAQPVHEGEQSHWGTEG